MEDKKEESGGMGSRWADYSHDHKRHIMKKIFMLILLVVVFAFGMEMGEIKGELRGFRGEHDMMRHRGGYSNFGGPRMMGSYGQNLPTATTPSAPGTVTPQTQVNQ